MTDSPDPRRMRGAAAASESRRRRVPQLPAQTPPQMPQPGSTEAVVLEVLRFQIQSLVTGDTRLWQHGLRRAQAVWGEDLGWLLFRGIEETLSAMRLARASAFHFSNPQCPRCARRLGPHEAQFLRVITEFSRGADHRAEAIAFLLCEANPCIDFLIAAKRLAQTLPSLSAR